MNSNCNKMFLINFTRMHTHQEIHILFARGSFPGFCQPRILHDIYYTLYIILPMAGETRQREDSFAAHFHWFSV